MPIKNFPFKALTESTDPKPLLPLKIINPKNQMEFNTWGLVDTGCDATSIPDFIAIELGHRVREGKIRDGNSASGIINFYEHTFRIEILGIDKNGMVKNDLPLIIIPEGTIEL